MLKIYRTYLASNFILPFIVSTVFFVSFLMTIEVFRIMSLISSDEISILFILGLMGNVVTTLIPMAVPLSILFSTIFCIGKLSGDSEYVALRAAGLTKNRILAPFMMVAIITSIVIFFFYQEIVPHAHKEVRTKIKIVSSTSLIQGFKSGQFFTRIPNITIFPTQVDETTNELKQVFIHMYDNNNKIDKIIVSKTGKIIHKKDESTGVESFKLFLKNGSIINANQTKSENEKILFSEYTLPISEQRFSYKASMKEIMMTRAELTEFIQKDMKEVEKLGFDKRDFVNANYEFWNRINTPLVCILFTFAGFGLGIKGNRGRSKGASSKAILVLLGYYVLFFATVSAAKDGNIPMFTIILIPNIVILLFSLKQYKNIDWIS